MSDIRITNPGPVRRVEAGDPVRRQREREAVYALIGHGWCEK